MHSYTVHTPPTPSEEERLSKAIFVRDGFHVVALIAPPLWLLWYRQWLGLALYIAMLIVLDFASDIASVWALSIINFLFGIGIALEASTLRRWRLGAKGWHLATVVSAHDLEDAEQRFFVGFTADREVETAPARVTSGILPIAAKSAAVRSVPSIIGYQQ